MITNNQLETAKKEFSSISPSAPLIERANPTGRYFFFAVDHEKTGAQLYPEKLSVTQVAQGGYSGDCYFLSVINAIIALPSGEQYIREAMIEQNEKIYVRYFKDDNPQWQVIEKSLPTTNGILSEGECWVRFLEKAYVAFRGGNYNKTLASGDSRMALKAFLGGNTESIPLSQQSRFTPFELYKKIIFGCNGQDIYSFIFLLRPHDKSATTQKLVQYIFANNNELLETWWQWVKQHQKGFIALLKANTFLTKTMFLTYLYHLARSSKNPPLPAIQAVEQWLNTYAILPDENHYSADEVELFTVLKKAYESQRPIICIPKEEPPEGIIMKHAYALIGIVESEWSHRKFLILRNPHHENRNWFSHLFLYGGRHAEEKHNTKNGKTQLVISPVHHSTFTMELRDFSHAFAYIDCGRSLTDKELLKQLEENPLATVLR